ncbi:MAG: flagellar basal body rod protein FlgC [Gammaproteobacteria bacterium]|nr:MAG: flagellar basal body rod protein FlgC [Gammaproteobacteria bacterium]
MSLFNVFDLSGTALSAQSVRLNTVASNMANAEVASSTAEGAYRARQPVFTAMLEQAAGSTVTRGVQVAGVMESQAPPRMEYMPGHPLANEDGYVFFPAVNMVEEMANMMSASRSYQNNVEMMNTVKSLMLRTLQLGQR